MPTEARPRIVVTSYDLMDTTEVADAFGCTPKSLSVAMSRPHVYPSLAPKLPAPLRKVGNAWVWLRVDIEMAVAL